MSDYIFEGWIALDKETGVGGMKWQQYEPKQFVETDIDIEISHCGKESNHLHCRVDTFLICRVPDGFLQTSQESVEAMFTLFEVVCSRPTILAVRAMSRKSSNCPCLELPTDTYQNRWYHHQGRLKGCWGSPSRNARRSRFADWM